MNRRFLLVIVAVCCATLSLSSMGWADPPGVMPDEVVFPTGEFPADVENVQAAVDRGGLVLLKATNVDGQPTAFNFGPADSATGGRVDIENDVWVLGETQASRMTAIEGGFVPFYGLKGHIRIESIHFVGPQYSAITIIQSTGAEVVSNRVTGVVPFDLGYTDPLGNRWTEASGIKFAAYSPITGKVVVAGNLIKVMHAAYIAEGIDVEGVDAEVSIEGNGIADVDIDGILMVNNRGPVRIADNFIVPGPGRGPDSLGNGIAITHSSSLFPSPSSFEVTRNRVICENPNADGIYLAGLGATLNAPVVSKNDVTMRGSLSGAMSFYGSVSHGSMSNNKIDGDGLIAFLLIGLGSGPNAESNTLNGNDISHFEASFADVFLWFTTEDTAVHGLVRSVIDLGVNNRISGPE